MKTLSKLSVTLKPIFLPVCCLLILNISCQSLHKNDTSNKKDIEASVNKNKELLNQWKPKASFCSSIHNSGNLGFWGLDDEGLPVFEYTAQLPTITYNKQHELINYPDDPFFLIGNNKLTLFTHASGEYELMTLERSVARLNYGNKPNSGANFAILQLGDQKYSLTGKTAGPGMSDLTEKAFGCGYAAYKYPIRKDIGVTRILSTLPSMKPDDGCPVFLVTVEINNNSNEPINFIYSEGLTARYDFTFKHNYEGFNIRTIYPVKSRTELAGNRVIADFIPTTESALVLTGKKHEPAVSESFPPGVYLQVDQVRNITCRAKADSLDPMSSKLSGEYQGIIPAHSGIKLCFYIGYTFYNNEQLWDTSVKMLREAASEKIPGNKAWKDRLPAFREEKNELLRAEMRWDAAVLYAMTTYSEIYQDLYVPQGNLYEYALGVGATTSDNAMQILPFNYMDPAFARSMLRYCLKQTDFRGFTNPSNEGAGRIPQAPWIKSHTPLYYIMAVGEYLKVTGDASFLNEEIPFYGMDYSRNGTVLDRLERLFLYLRDEVYVGQHGLTRILLSDWNDAFYFIFKNEDFFSTFRNGESFSNTGMALLYLGQLTKTLNTLKDAPVLQSHQGDIYELIRAATEFRSELKTAFLREWGDHPYIPRAYLGSGKEIGLDNLYLESQSFALGIEDIPVEKRLKLWQEIKKLNGADEKYGIRQAEYASGNGPDGKGSGEDAGFWYSLNGPMINGLIGIDRNEAMKTLNRIRLTTHAEKFPDYWVGMWSGPDTFDSSLSPNEGIVRTWGRIFPVYCAHAHSWVLWNYYAINDGI